MSRAALRGLRAALAATLPSSSQPRTSGSRVRLRLELHAALGGLAQLLEQFAARGAPLGIAEGDAVQGKARAHGVGRMVRGERGAFLQLEQALRVVRRARLGHRAGYAPGLGGLAAGQQHFALQQAAVQRLARIGRRRDAGKDSLRILRTVGRKPLAHGTEAQADAVGRRIAGSERRVHFGGGGVVALACESGGAVHRGRRGRGPQTAARGHQQHERRDPGRDLPGRTAAMARGGRLRRCHAAEQA